MVRRRSISHLFPDPWPMNPSPFDLGWYPHRITIYSCCTEGFYFFKETKTLWLNKVRWSISSPIILGHIHTTSPSDSSWKWKCSSAMCSKAPSVPLITGCHGPGWVCVLAALCSAPLIGAAQGHSPAAGHSLLWLSTASAPGTVLRPF